MRKPLKVFYNCAKCPAYCCSYERIEVTPHDLRRLAKSFAISQREFKKKYTKKGEEKGEIILRHKKDEHFGTVCQFLDSETRMCGVYGARPKACRDYPKSARCGYYEFLKFEREWQDDPEYVALTSNC
ncbi:MAG: YkgJ family cysteine cluster protein [Armatimonadetes bacterium]|nr:YkgJ family cysteine cluster protein [Armatimonadota bacterium]